MMIDETKRALRAYLIYQEGVDDWLDDIIRIVEHPRPIECVEDGMLDGEQMLTVDKVLHDE